MRRLPVALVPALLAACADVTVTDGGVAAIELLVPAPAQVEVGQTRTLTGSALDANGDPLPIPLVWYALDTTLVMDSTAGRLTGVQTGTGRILARAADLYSREVRFTVVVRVDTVIRVAEAELDVAEGETLSPALTVRLAAGEAGAGVPQRQVRFEITSPVFPSPDDRTVEFTNGSLVLLAATAASGETAPRLQRVTGRTPPAEVVVTFRAFRPGGESIPGSGQTYLVRFADGATALADP